MSKKKQEEVKYFNEARQVSNIFPLGEVEENEKPDFLLRTDNGFIGIELTELCRENPRGEGGKLLKLPETAQKSYSELVGMAPVDVSVGFSLDAVNLKFNHLKKSLVNFVCSNQGNIGQTFNLNLPTGFCSIGIFSPLENYMGVWRGARGFNTVIAPKELIESCITKKNKLFRSYHKDTSRVWLLIINDQFLGPGEVFARPEDLAKWKFDFNFEKVLLFLREPGGSGQVIELLRAN